MKTLKFKLYENKRNRYLKRMINAAGCIYNHCIALHRRYYRRFKKHLNVFKLQKHIAKLRKRNSYWQLVGSQAVQDICQRIEKAYRRFFSDKKAGKPSFKKVRKYKSFTLKQAGYKFLGGNRIKIGNKVYQFWKSREIEGTVKTVTVKRSPLGELFLAVVVDKEKEHTNKTATGKTAGAECTTAFLVAHFPAVRRRETEATPELDSGRVGGFDFGLKVFLTSSDGQEITSPEFLKQSLKELAKASKQLSSKRKGSNNWQKARLNLVRKHEQIVNRRRDWFWKLAHQLTNQYDVLCFETLNLKGMKRLWGRKISDLAFAEFLKILDFVAQKKGKVVSYIDRWYPSSKTCSECDFVIDKLGLNERYWVCPSCSTKHGRDANASRVIHKVGITTLRLGDVSQLHAAISA